ncbi:MAG: putative hydro-lyase [Alphaproteobacteria bacterium]|nr:MAG: putative hydro-lyase [Alphaproteobacteria bacterium]
MFKPPSNLSSAQTSHSSAGLSARLMCRSGQYTETSAGLAPGLVQGNLVILPESFAHDFLRFCIANPKPCPVLGVTDVGSPMLPALGQDLDVRTDLPRYRVWRDGHLVAEPTDIRALWREDLVGFVLGCSFSFEAALQDHGLALRHIECGRTVAMFRTALACTPVGPFAGPMVVSMRPFSPADAIRAIQITSRFPAVHGAPVHFGDPSLIGIKSLDQPDYGEPIPVADGEVPVFWACGVTPQAVVEAARLPFAITHAPGAMLVTDLSNHRLAVF